MGWDTTGCTVTRSKSVAKSVIGQQQIDYESEAGEFPQYRIHVNVMFFGKSTQTVTTIHGLTKAGAEAMVNAENASISEWTDFTKAAYTGAPAGFTATIQYEKHSKTTSMRRADPSGQYVVEIVETNMEAS